MKTVLKIFYEWAFSRVVFPLIFPLIFACIGLLLVNILFYTYDAKDTFPNIIVILYEKGVYSLLGISILMSTIGDLKGKTIFRGFEMLIFQFLMVLSIFTFLDSLALLENVILDSKLQLINLSLCIIFSICLKFIEINRTHKEQLLKATSKLEQNRPQKDVILQNFTIEEITQEGLSLELKTTEKTRPQKRIQPDNAVKILTNTKKRATRKHNEERQKHKSRKTPNA